jgi:hypothetical protein
VRHHDVSVRTTLTLDPDVARLLEEEVHRARKSFKEVVNDAIRRGLAPSARRPAAAPYRVRPHVTRLVAGVDPQRFNALVDELEDAALVSRKAFRAAEPKRRRR